MPPVLKSLQRDRCQPARKSFACSHPRPPILYDILYANFEVMSWNFKGLPEILLNLQYVLNLIYEFFGNTMRLHGTCTGVTPAPPEPLQTSAFGRFFVAWPQLTQLSGQEKPPEGGFFTGC